MTTIKVIFFGMMLAWMPSLILLAYLLWREGVGHRNDRGDRLRSLFLSHGLEFEDHPPNSDAHRSNPTIRCEHLESVHIPEFAQRRLIASKNLRTDSDTSSYST
jgi:hypothetical protein